MSARAAPSFGLGRPPSLSVLFVLFGLGRLPSFSFFRLGLVVRPPFSFLALCRFVGRLLSWVYVDLHSGAKMNAQRAKMNAQRA